MRCGNSVDASRDCQMMCGGSAAMDGWQQATDDLIDNGAMLMVDNAQSKRLIRYVHRWWHGDGWKLSLIHI